MKSLFKNVFTLIFLIAFTISATPLKNNSIYGTWKLVSGKHSGVPAPDFMSDRIQYFKNDQTFQSVITSSNRSKVISNQGNFYLINDSTVVTYHRDRLGTLDKITNTYNFQIKNDTLHFYGYFLKRLPNNPHSLMEVYIDEFWEKVKISGQD